MLAAFIHASANVSLFTAPALLFADVLWEFDLPLCGASMAVPFSVSMEVFVIAGGAVVPFNVSTGALLARAHHGAM